VAGWAHPAAATTGLGTVVGTAEGRVVVGELVVVVVVEVEVVVVACTSRTDWGEPHADAIRSTASAVPAPTRRPGAT
jgi:hypothetical protein